MTSVKYINHGKVRPNRHVRFPTERPTISQVRKALENLRTLWRNSKLSREIDLKVYECIQTAKDMLKRGYPLDADNWIYEGIETITEHKYS